MVKVTDDKVKQRGLRAEFAHQFFHLTTSSLGLVAALAWNEVIKEIVSQYIKPLVGGASGLISLLIYALVVTILFVITTFNLTKILNKK